MKMTKYKKTLDSMKNKELYVHAIYQHKTGEVTSFDCLKDFFLELLHAKKFERLMKDSILSEYKEYYKED